MNIPFSAAEDGSQFVGIPAMTEEYAAGYRVVQINGTDASGVEIEDLEAAIRILFDPPAVGGVPVQSSDNGVTWYELPLLSTPELPAGQRDGYFVNSDGTVWIFTRHLSMFGILAEQAIPLNIASNVLNLNPGDTAQLTVTGGEGNGEVTVESLSPGVCAVDSSLLVTSIASGTCTVRATKGSSGRYIEATTSLSLTVAGQSIPSIESPDKVVEVDTPVADKPAEQPKNARKPKQQKQPKQSDSDSSSGSSTDESTNSSKDAESGEESQGSDAVDSGLAVRIAEAQALAASPFTPGVDSPTVDGTRIAVVTENGESIEVTVSVVLTDNGLVITGDGFSMQLTVVDRDGNPIPVDDAKRLVLQEGAVLTLKGSGFAPNSTVTLWLFSQPLDLGGITANAQGEVEVSVTLPAGVELGEHTVQLTGVSAEGELRVFNVAIMVEEAPTDGGLPILPVAAGLVALALVGAFLAMRRRSADEPVAQP